jgi:UDP-sugar transporter A1/2/3
MMSKYGYLIQNSLTMLVPAAIYLAMNILGFLSLKYIDAATFAIIAQVSCMRGTPRQGAALNLPPNRLAR